MDDVDNTLMERAKVLAFGVALAVWTVMCMMIAATISTNFFIIFGGGLLGALLFIFMLDNALKLFRR